MSKISNKLYKGFSVSPTQFFDLNSGEVLDSEKWNYLLCKDVDLLTQLVEWQFSTSAFSMLEDLRKYQDSGGSMSFFNKVGQALEIYLPGNIKKNHKSSSRFEWSFQTRVVRELSSWLERVKAVEGDSSKRISQGWSRTANREVPSDFDSMMPLSPVCKQYCEIINDPFEDGYIVMSLVIGNSRAGIAMPFDKNRFSGGAKLCLPNVRVIDDKAIFDFSVEYEYIYSDISSQYVVGVDVGISNYATIAVVDTSNDSIVHSSTLSQRVHSLYNSVKSSNRQAKFLSEKDYEEASLHRKSASRKKRELAIIAAQEIADIASIFNNAVVIVEDLSWIKNTMNNGRWNRGELVKWIEHYSQFNGSRTFSVNAAYTSKRCHICNCEVSIRKWHTAVCTEHGVMNRDVNAAANIALRFKESLVKVVSSRRKSRKFTNAVIQRSPATRKSLKYPGVDRTKNSPTRKRPKKSSCKKHDDIFPSKEVLNKNAYSTSCNDDRTVVVDDRFESESPVRTLEEQYYSRTTMLENHLGYQTIQKERQK